MLGRACGFLNVAGDLLGRGALASDWKIVVNASFEVEDE
jgi:hypothetical protein